MFPSRMTIDTKARRRGRTAASPSARVAAREDADFDPADWRWRAVMERDSAFDGRFVYAVSTTGVFCRPSCPSRRPHRKNVRFFDSTEAATVGGFRACLRCRPEELPRAAAAVVDARELLDRHAASGSEGRLTLDALASAVGMSPFHLQRVFKAHVGLTPAEYLRQARAERLKSELKRGETVSRATYGAGFGSSSRAYEASEVHLGMTPATYRRGGSGAAITYRVATSRFGHVLVAATPRGVCAVSLGDDPSTLEADLRAEYPKATFAKAAAHDDEFGTWVDGIVRFLEGVAPPPSTPLDLQATAFQWRVWRALQQIPIGETRSYAEVAAAIGAPSSARAVARACASNRVAMMIPCHRVVRSDGDASGYRWGAERKRRILAAERSVAERKA